MDRAPDAACELLLDACDAVRRHERSPWPPAPALRELACLRETLADEADGCPDAALADDLDGVRAEVEALLVRLEALPRPAPALTG